jgi:type II secretion system protein J
MRTRPYDRTGNAGGGDGDREARTLNAGFTLIEVLVATVIASIILLMAYASYRSIFDSIKRSIGRAEFYENVNLAIMKIDQDLSNTYFTKTNKKICFICESDRGNSRLDFVSVLHNDFNVAGTLKTPVHMSDVKGVGYHLREAKNTMGLYHLIKREKFNYWEDDPLSGGVESVLLPNVVSLKFEFQKGNDWEDNWDSRQNNLFPKSVKTTLVIKNYQAEEEKFTFITLMNIKEYR